MQDYRRLEVWKRAHRLTLRVYRLAEAAPSRRHTALFSQIRRAAVSVPANIAEGCGKDSQQELGRYLQIAIGSGTELEYHLLLAGDLGVLPHAVCTDLQQELTQVIRMLVVLRQRVRSIAPAHQSLK